MSNFTCSQCLTSETTAVGLGSDDNYLHILRAKSGLTGDKLFQSEQTYEMLLYAWGLVLSGLRDELWSKCFDPTRPKQYNPVLPCHVNATYWKSKLVCKFHLFTRWNSRIFVTMLNWHFMGKKTEIWRMGPTQPNAWMDPTPIRVLSSMWLTINLVLAGCLMS